MVRDLAWHHAAEGVKRRRGAGPAHSLLSVECTDYLLLLSFHCDALAHACLCATLVHSSSSARCGVLLLLVIRCAPCLRMPWPPLWTA